MGFKVKKWGEYPYEVDARDLLASAVGTTPAGDGNPDTGWAYSVGGRVLLCFYDSALDYAACWAFYDPATHSWDGPHYLPAAVEVGRWQWHSEFYGDMVWVYPGWGDAYDLVVTGAYSSWTTGQPGFYAWKPDGTFQYWNTPPHPYPDKDEKRGPYRFVSCGIDASGLPVRMVRYLWGPWHPNVTDEGVYAYGPGGQRTIYAGDVGLYFPTNSDGQDRHDARLFGQYINLNVEGCPDLPDHSYLFGGWPTDGFECSPSVRAGITSVAPWRVGPKGEPYGNVEVVNADGTTEQRLVHVSAPTTAVSWPWSTWEYRRTRDGGGYGLSDRDLDGVSHGVPDTSWWPLQDAPPPTQNPADGLYTTVRHTTQVLTPYIYRLDPYQPTVWAPAYKALPGMNVEAWSGNVCIRPARGGGYRAEHKFPSPGRGVDSSRCPIELESGEVISLYHMWAPGGSGFVHKRPLSIDLQGYPTEDEDWWWVEGDPMDHLLETVCGPKRLLMGRYPDPGWGSFSPLGQDVRYGIGAPEPTGEDEPNPSHIMQNSDIVSGSKSWAEPPGSKAQGIRRHLVSDRKGERFYWVHAWFRPQQFPRFTALVGEIADDTWTTLFDVSELEPDLGQDGGTDDRAGWTIWSLNPIPKCKALPKGGFLVGATLYFAPWGDQWEWDAGSRNATFLDTGKGYVPALPDYEGPYQVEPKPKLVSATDEWTANRSVYGSDALLVYDHEGNFVTHLNHETMHAVDARYVVVTQDRSPKVIYRLYRYGAYSDYGEQYGAIVDTEGDVEANVPALAVYDLEAPDGTIKPGGGRWRDWVDWSSVTGTFVNRQDAVWSWLKSSYNQNYPRDWWGGRIFPAYRPGLGGRTITPLSPGLPSSRGGVRGVGSPAR